MTNLYQHTVHPHVEARKEVGPVKLADQHARGNAAQRFNAWVATRITAIVGTVWCFWVFNGLASASAKAAFSTHSMTIIINWVSSNWLQLVLLPALMVGQNLQGKAADARADATWKDAEAILHGLEQAQAHLDVQDQHLLTQDDKLAAIVDQVSAAVLRLTPPA
jgi:hypothetical protein